MIERKLKKSQIDLPIPYFSQKEEQVMQKYGRKACVLTALRMVLAFYGKEISFEDLYNIANQNGAYKEELGWIHAGLINMARDLGLKGFRINFSMLAERDLEKAKPILAKEGASLTEIAAFENSVHLAQNKGRLAAVDDLLQKGIPIIASMEKTYSQTLATHAVVIKGKQNNNYILQDPWDFGPEYHISQQKFDENWTKRAIIIYK